MIDLRRPRRSRDGKASQSGSASCTLLDSVTCLAASSSRRCISLFHQRLVGCTSNRSSKRCRSSLKLERDACSNGVGGKTSPGIPCKRCSHRSATAASYAPSAKERRVGTANVVVGREGDHLSTTHCVCSEKRDVASTTILEGSVQKERERERERERDARAEVVGSAVCLTPSVSQIRATGFVVLSSAPDHRVGDEKLRRTALAPFLTTTVRPTRTYQRRRERAYSFRLRSTTSYSVATSSGLENVSLFVSAL